MLKTTADERAVIFAEHITGTGQTVRATADRFSVSKSTVHKYVTDRLRSIDPELHAEVRAVLERNKAQRHIRGGNATKQKYLLLRSAAPEKAPEE